MTLNRQHHAAFYDYGGTIFDYKSDNHCHRKIMEAAAKRYGIEADPDKVEATFTKRLWHEYTDGIGKTTVKGQAVSNHAFEQTLKEYGYTGLKDEDFQWYENTVIDFHCKYVKMYPLSVEILKLTKELGYFLGLISDFDEVFLHEMMKCHGIFEMFDTITCSEEAGYLKPSKGIFDAAFAKSPRIKPERSIYVGDNPNRDMLGAKEYGMTTIFLDVGRSPEGYERYIDYTVKNIGDIDPILRELKPGGN